MSSRFDLGEHRRQQQEEALRQYVADQRSEPLPAGGKPNTKAEKRALRQRRHPAPLAGVARVLGQL